MIPIYNAWCCQIELTNCCGRNCLYCSRYNRHLRHDQLFYMPLDVLEKALDSLREWPGRIGIIGGEPLLHPQFKDACELIKTKFPKKKMYLWTSGGEKWKEFKPLVDETFSDVAYNEHNEKQKQNCRHQPLTIAIKEVVPDESIRKQLIDNCWVQRTWCPTITPYGAYFCEVAGAQDILLNNGKNAWPIADDWWKKNPSQFQDQVVLLCDNCGMAIPMERELILKFSEKFSPGLLNKFRSLNLKHVSDKATEVFDHKFSNEELASNIQTWYPGNYREDLKKDEISGEGRGFTMDLKWGSNMKIEIITMWYNEAFLAPFFLNHYSFANTIHLLYDEDTTDNSLDIISKFKNVKLIPFRFPDMMDDILKIEKINSVYRTLDCDWVISVDSDEFIFPLPLGRDLREILMRESKYNLYYVQFWQVYRHRNDSDLDPALPAVYQRRHGDPNISKGLNSLYIKPIVARPGLNIEWMPGCHKLKKKSALARIWDVATTKRVSISPQLIFGAHWAMADPGFAIERRINGRMKRQSKRNIQLGLTVQHHNITAEQIQKECERHLDDPLLF